VSKRARETVSFFPCLCFSPSLLFEGRKDVLLTSLAHQHDRAQQLGKVRVVRVAVRQLGVGEEPLDPRGGRGGGLVVGLCRGRRDPADRRVDRGAGPGGEDATEGEDAAEAGEAEGPAAGAARRGDLFFFGGGAERGKREEEVRKEEKREPLREGEKAFWPRWSACQAQAPSPAKTPKRIDHLKTTPRDRLFIFLLPITCPRDQKNRADELARAIIGTEVSWSTGRDRGNRIKICSPNGKDFFSYEESLMASTFFAPSFFQHAAAATEMPKIKQTVLQGSF